MINLKSYTYKLLKNDSALVAQLGTTDHILNAWPDTFLVFPVVIFQDDNQSDSEYADNVSNASDVRIRIDIFTKKDLSSVTTSAIGINVDRIFKAESFNCGTNGESPDEDPTISHRVMRFSRKFFSGEI